MTYTETGPERRGLLGALGDRLAFAASAPFFFVASFFTYYGQLNRVEGADTWGPIYTALALVKRHTIWLDAYFPILQQHAGEHPYFVTTGPGGHLVQAVPGASTLLAVPVVAVFSAAGVDPSHFGTWLEAGLLTAALVAAATVALAFRLLLRLTTRRRAALLTAAFAWGTLQWGISGQALWQHTGATLALVIALIAFVDRRLALAGAMLGAMVAFRLNTAALAIFLVPLVGLRLRDWGRFALGLSPYVAAWLAYNAVAYGSPLHQGYGTGHLTQEITPHVGQTARAALALLVSPGRGLFVYMPIFLFAVVGVIRGWRRPLYLWSGIASLVYLVVAANAGVWYGGQCFGPRRLTDALPLLVVLLVPALDAIVATGWRWLFAAALAWSVFVELLGAAATPPSYWFDTHPEPIAFAAWWKPGDNEIEAKLLHGAHLPVRLTETVLLLAFALALGYVTSVMLAARRRA